jgi:hypothetical protein
LHIKKLTNKKNYLEKLKKIMMIHKFQMKEVNTIAFFQVILLHKFQMKQVNTIAFFQIIFLHIRRLKQLFHR